MKPVASDQLSVKVTDIQAVMGECCYCDESRLMVAACMTCVHMPTACKGCLARFIDAEYAKPQIACPQCKVFGGGRLYNCVLLWCPRALQEVLTEEDIRHGIGEQRDNWEKTLPSKIHRAFDMVPCAAPDCGQQFMKEDIGDLSCFTCPSCSQTTCVECNTLVHPGRTCAENQAIKGTAAELGSDVQKCPKCKVQAVKDGDDCDRLNCLMCASAFCAKCSAPYDGKFGLRQTDNSAHEPACSNYREPEPGARPVHERRREEEKSKSRRKSESPPPTSKSVEVLWTMIAPDDVM